MRHLLGITFYDFDCAMRGAMTLHTKRWGWVCFRPTSNQRGWVSRWYFYVSPNGTPWASTFAIGPGVSKREKTMAPLRRRLWGHNFNTDRFDSIALDHGMESLEYQCDTNNKKSPHPSEVEANS